MSEPFAPVVARKSPFAISPWQPSVANISSESNYPGAPGPLITEDLRAQLKNLRLQHREELGVLLGAEDFEQYLVRESDEVGYVLHHLPQAHSEEEFRLWVQAAIDVGVEQADIQADRISALLPTSASNSTAPSLRDRVLKRFRELSDNAERFHEL